MTSLLNCMRIVFSYKVDEDDLSNLTAMSEKHLHAMITLFEAKLKPKQHNLTHYPNVIRQMGPLKLMWMMRFESKHKYFTSIAKKTNNFTNLTKTLAENHQSYICWKNNSYKDDIEISKKYTPFNTCKDFALFQPILERNSPVDISSFNTVKFLKVNNSIYKKGLMFINENSLHEIIFILDRNNEDYYLICQVYKSKKIRR